MRIFTSKNTFAIFSIVKEVKCVELCYSWETFIIYIAV